MVREAETAYNEILYENKSITLQHTLRHLM
jgi:hypothetical protein